MLKQRIRKKDIQAKPKTNDLQLTVDTGQGASDLKWAPGTAGSEIHVTLVALGAEEAF